MNLNNKSKQLAYLLRHDRKNGFDTNGWRKVSDLVCNHGFYLEVLQNIVNTNDRQRFEFSSDMQCIRARQGHSIHVDVELEECVPPSVLYHGTAKHFVDDILNDGLKPQNRIHVHLSSTIETAINVGKRHGVPVVFKNDSQRDGVKFYLSRNG